jgi:hypothetical protein
MTSRYADGMGLPPADFRNEPLPDSVDPDDLPTLTDDQFPNTVVTKNERLRFRLAYSVALDLFPDEPIMVWATANSIYNNPRIRTGE